MEMHLFHSTFLGTYKLPSYMHHLFNNKVVFYRYQSSSCGVRSGISCYNLGTRLTFPETWLKSGHNSIVLSLPFNATDYESAVLPVS